MLGERVSWDESLEYNFVLLGTLKKCNADKQAIKTIYERYTQELTTGGLSSE